VGQHHRALKNRNEYRAKSIAKDDAYLEGCGASEAVPFSDNIVQGSLPRTKRRLSESRVHNANDVQM
jgi:hypothetical protein